MDYDIAIEEFEDFEKELRKFQKKNDKPEFDPVLNRAIFRNLRMLLNNFYASGDSRDRYFHKLLDELESRTEFHRIEQLTGAINGFLYTVNEDLRVRQKLQESLDEKNSVKKTANVRTNTYKPHFYIVLFLLLTTLNISLPIHQATPNWKIYIGIEVALVASFLIFYFRDVPTWVQFLVGTVLAILAIVLN